jgi:hypothetical protein
MKLRAAALSGRQTKGFVSSSKIVPGIGVFFFQPPENCWELLKSARAEAIGEFAAILSRLPGTRNLV